MEVSVAMWGGTGGVLGVEGTWHRSGEHLRGGVMEEEGWGEV